MRWAVRAGRRRASLLSPGFRERVQSAGSCSAAGWAVLSAASRPGASWACQPGASPVPRLAAPPSPKNPSVLAMSLPDRSRRLRKQSGRQLRPALNEGPLALARSAGRCSRPWASLLMDEKGQTSDPEVPTAHLCSAPLRPSSRSRRWNCPQYRLDSVGRLSTFLSTGRAGASKSTTKPACLF